MPFLFQLLLEEVQQIMKWIEEIVEKEIWNVVDNMIWNMEGYIKNFKDSNHNAK